MPNHTDGCQSTYDNLMVCSDPHLVSSRVILFGWCLKHLGLARTTGMVLSKIRRMCRRDNDHRASEQRRKSVIHGGEELHLQPGEVVEVKSESEIRKSLDEHGRHRGLLWMPSMARFCGKRYTVHKRIETMMLETTGELRKVRNTVLLENVTCEDLYGCDRSCFHYWREVWLRRVPAELGTDMKADQA